MAAAVLAVALLAWLMPPSLPEAASLPQARPAPIRASPPLAALDYPEPDGAVLAVIRPKPPTLDPWPEYVDDAVARCVATDEVTTPQPWRARLRTRRGKVSWVEIDGLGGWASDCVRTRLSWATLAVHDGGHTRAGLSW